MESDLVRQYARMSDDELQTQFVSGQLDEGSLALLMAELNRRAPWARGSFREYGR